MGAGQPRRVTLMELVQALEEALCERGIHNRYCRHDEEESP